MAVEVEFNLISDTVLLFRFEIQSIFWSYCCQRLLNYLAFQSFGFERVWWNFFHESFVRTKLDVYLFIIRCLFSFIMEIYTIRGLTQQLSAPISSFIMEIYTIRGLTQQLSAPISSFLCRIICTWFIWFI
jgi:hypothetical protein